MKDKKVRELYLGVQFFQNYLEDTWLQRFTLRCLVSISSFTLRGGFLLLQNSAKQIALVQENRGR